MKRITLVISLFLFFQIAHAQDSSWIKTAFETTIQYHAQDGNLMEVWTVDTDGKLVNNNLGFAIIKYKYDKNGNIIEQVHIDSQRNPAVDNLGVSIWKFKFDKNNNKIYQGHFGTDGKLIPANDKIIYSEWFWKYTKKGKLKKTKTKNRRN